MTATPAKLSATGYYDNARREMLAFVPQDAYRILDIGCGSGAFARLLQESTRKEIWGIELDASAAAIATASMHKVMCGPAEQHLDALPDHYFDCIVLNDVLEHLIDPWGMLIKLKNKLSAVGVIVASIPNVRHYKNLWNLLAAGDWQYTDAGILDKTHLRFFTARTTRQLFEDQGYRIVEFQGLRGTRKFKIKLLQWLTLGRCWDIAFPQFAIVAAQR